MSRLEVTFSASRVNIAVDEPRALQWAGVAFFAEAAIFTLVMVIAGAMAPGYGLNAGAISDLGVFPETAVLFNVAMVAIGLLNIAGALLFHRSHASVWTTGLFVAAGAGAVGVGLFHLDTAPDAHGLSALLAFLCFGLQPAALAIRLRGGIQILAIVASLAALAFLVVMVIGDGGNEAVFGSIGHGGTERMIVYPIMLWMMAFGGYLMGVARH